MTQASSNPLLQPHTLPPFSAIRPEHMAEAVKIITEENLQQLSMQLQSLQEPSWETLVAPLELREDRLNQAFSPISHLNGVMNNDDVRKAYEASIAQLTQYNTQMGQNKKLYEAYTALKDSSQYDALGIAERKTIDNAIRDFKLAGVGLPEDQKQRYADIQEALSQLSNQFSNNVLDATQGWIKHIETESELSGMPESAMAAARQAAQSRDLPGWVLTLDGPVYLTVMTQADNAELRREMYTAYMTRASEEGPNAGRWDNTDIIDQILRLRQELAGLLGFGCYAEYSLEAKMAESTQQVVAFLTELADEVKLAAQRELRELQAWVRDQFGLEDLAVWDIPYYSEKMKEARYDVSQERLRPYFTLPKVLDGLFGVVRRLFGVEVIEQTGGDVWHQDARFFVVKRDGQVIAQLYLDLYARQGKRGGAWMAECRVRRRTDAGIQKPVAFLVCNFNAPPDGSPALLTHNEVTTLFHEFGHGLHHMLTQVEVGSVSGINGVAWDAVELPSQFMENWCWQPEVLRSLSEHVDTGEPLSDELITKLLAAKNFQVAMMTLRQIEFALFDFRLHMEYGRDTFPGVQTLLDQVREQVAVVLPPTFNRFQNGFSHIFAGGYAAGYYSYKWAEVLSADAFAAFEERGLFDPQVGQAFLHCILEQGGAQDAMTLFKRFRGREPSIEPLLRHTGIMRDE